VKHEEFTPKNIERAHWWLAKATDSLEEARILLPSGRTRSGATSRLYYAAHHAACSLLRLVGVTTRSHSAVKNAFGQQWIKRRGLPVKFAALLVRLEDDRHAADYGEFVATDRRSMERSFREVRDFIARARREIPEVTTAQILALIVEKNPEIRDFSFDIYCPKTYFHHTRLTAWTPKGRVSAAWLERLLREAKSALQALRVAEAEDYVLGLNSRVNQYRPQHILMLDLDDVSSVLRSKFANEPGFLFRTGSGFHFIGARLYSYAEWKSRMRSFLPLASKQHYQLSVARGYGTLRLTSSARKPQKPVYIGQTG
jgi:uncharacterized protein (UPF0332 family)